MHAHARFRAAATFVVLGAALGPAVALAPPATGAAAGGGCHRAVSEGQSKASGTSVELVGNCMTPTVLHTDPGATVTFTNSDGMAHNILATTWGTTELLPGDELAQTFDEAGAYPYACTIHPGMVGVILVGDGSDAVARVVDAQPAVASEAVTSDGADSSGGVSGPAVAGIAAAAALAAGALGRWSRRPRIPERSQT